MLCTHVIGVVSSHFLVCSIRCYSTIDSSSGRYPGSIPTAAARAWGGPLHAAVVVSKEKGTKAVPAGAVQRLESAVREDEVAALGGVSRNVSESPDRLEIIFELNTSFLSNFIKINRNSLLDRE